jgi:hypothetical protein
VRVARETAEDGVPGMGIAFVGLTGSDRDAILELVTRGQNG